MRTSAFCSVLGTKRREIMFAATCDSTYITLLRSERVLHLSSPFPITTAALLSHHTVIFKLVKRAWRTTRLLHCRPFVQKWPWLAIPPRWLMLCEESASCFSTSRRHRRQRRKLQCGTDKGSNEVSPYASRPAATVGTS